MTGGGSDPVAPTAPARRRSGAGRMLLAIAVAVLATAVVLVVGLALPRDGSALDRSLGALAASRFPSIATTVFDAAASLPAVLVLTAVPTVWAWFRGRIGVAVVFVAGLAAAVPTELVKILVDRPRPPGDTSIQAFGSPASYPSGHTVRAVVLAGSFALALLSARRRTQRRRRVALGLILLGSFAGLVGIARIASGDHWPSDVLGGAGLGAGWLPLMAAFGCVASRLSGEPSDGSVGTPSA